MAKGTRYTPEFKAKAVRLLTESRGSYPSETKAIEQVAKDPEVAAETLGRWRCLWSNKRVRRHHQI